MMLLRTMLGNRDVARIEIAWGASSLGNWAFSILLLGSRARTADVLALTSMQLLELSKDAYEQYVSGVSDVGAELRDVAGSRLASDDRA